MPRFSVSLDDDQAKWVRSEAADRDRSQADVIRQCIGVVRNGAVDTDTHHTGSVQSDALDDLRDRVAELEQRLDAALEDDLNQHPAPETGDSLVKTASEAVSSPSEPRGLSGEDAVVEWVREHQPASRKEIVTAFEDAAAERGIKPDSWWRRHARPALKEAGAEYTKGQGWAISTGS